MAQTTTQDAESARTNGVGEEIRVENPATGEIVGSVPRMTPADVAPMVARARVAQPGWEALGFDGRGKVLRRAQKWLLDNSDRVIETIVSETGKTYEDAQLAEISYAAAGFGFWAKHAGEYLADERIKASTASRTWSSMISICLGKVIAPTSTLPGPDDGSPWRSSRAFSVIFATNSS